MTPFTRSGPDVFWRGVRVTPDDVDVTPGLDGYRVWLGPFVVRSYRTASNAARDATRLRAALFDALQFARDGAVEPRMEAA